MIDCHSVTGLFVSTGSVRAVSIQGVKQMRKPICIFVWYAACSIAYAQTNAPSPDVEPTFITEQIVLKESALSPNSTDALVVQPERIIFLSDGSTRRENLSSGGGGLP